MEGKKTISKLQEMEPIEDGGGHEEVNKTAEEIPVGIDFQDEDKQDREVDSSDNNPVFKSTCK